MRIDSKFLFGVLNFIRTDKKYEGDKPLQYGTQYIVGGVFVDIHTSAKKKGTFTLDIKNHPANPDFARQLQEYIDAACEPEDDSAI
ncbi:hypothetical protein [Pseudomonas sp. OV546]|uniref:hypothetical protein n=1 Tax=Pseudomonas sp. OV546 TaxID=1881063 RepID=UPI0008EF97B8|nr:hypothetical protein [Pseudomonas sp. OV546]SFV12770.1 hypothetical protein SAMN05428951_11995 [Pseudomonas sp. OV546]